MTNKVYCVRQLKASLLLLVSKPLNGFKVLSTSPRVVYCKCLPTEMTNKVYPIRQPLASLAVLVSKPLKHLKRALLH